MKVLITRVPFGVIKRIIVALFLLCECVLATSARCSEPDWTGQWEFGECWPHVGAEMSDRVLYTLEVGRNLSGKDYSVEIETNGHMTEQRILAKGVIRNNTLEIIFKKLDEDNMGPNYKRGDILLSLIQRNDTTITEWSKIEPVLKSNKAPAAYFKKVNGPYGFNGEYTVNITGHGNDGKDEFCNDFRLTPKQAKFFFRSAHRITGIQLAQDYDWLSCYVTGTITDKTGRYIWKIRPIGIGYLQTPRGEEINLGCKTCDEIFK